MVAGGGGVWGMDWEFGVSRCKLVYIEWLNNKVLLGNTENYFQYLVIYHMENNTEKEKVGASLVVQWLRISLAMQGTRVGSLWGRSHMPRSN